MAEAGCPLGGFSHNIAEGSQASGTSTKMELKLTNVARASLEELKLDYEDFLRQRDLPLWSDGDPRRKALVARRCRTADEVAAWVAEMRNGRYGHNGPAGHASAYSSGASNQNGSAQRFSASIESIPSIQSIPPTKPTYTEVAANAAHVLIGVACALLGRQVESQAAAFENDGGFTERLYRVRSGRRN